MQEQSTPTWRMRLVVILAICGVLGALGLILFVFPWMFTGSWKIWNIYDYITPRTTDSKIALVSVQLAASVAVVQLLGSMLLVFVIYSGYQSLKHTQAQIEVARETQITDRFTKAIEQLGATDPQGKPIIEVRLGAIYALERISKDSPKDHWTIVEILSAYVREQAPSSEDEEYDGDEPLKKLRTDIQAAVTVLGRRPEALAANDPGRIDLTNTNLRGLNGVGLFLKRVDFTGSQMQDAWFNGAQLQGAQFNRSQLQWALFISAQLQGVDLSGAKDLTWERIDAATTDENTLLPDYLLASRPGWPNWEPEKPTSPPSVTSEEPNDKPKDSYEEANL